MSAKKRTYIHLTDADLADAREFLKERVRAQQSMSHNMKLLIEAAAAEIVRIAYSLRMPASVFSFSADRTMEREVNNVLENLINEIDEDVELLATYGHEERDADILSYIHRETHDNTFYGRLADYKDKFKDELEIGIASGLYLHKSEGEVLKSIIDNEAHPFLNPFIKEAIGHLDFDIPNYGRGHSNSMLTAMTGLTVYAVAEGWMFGQWLDAVSDEAVGFVTFRNSSFPCITCDDYSGWVHPMTDPIPPLHLNCVCGVYYIYPSSK